MNARSLLRYGEGGYHTYRIPAAVRQTDGRLLFFCEGRKDSASDFAEIHLLVLRSDDDGTTWSAPTVVHREGTPDEQISIGNPSPVHDADTGRTVLLFTRDNEAVFVTRTDDGGESWSTPREITGVCPSDWVRHWTGPGAGIQLRHGDHGGRLLVPSYHIERCAGRDTLRSHAFLSDDGGETWRVSGSTAVPSDWDAPRFDAAWWPGGFDWAGCECLAAELPAGEIYMTVRNQVQFRRQKAWTRSGDGGESWSPLGLHPEIPGLRCQSGLTRWTAVERAGEAVLLLSEPAGGAADGTSRTERRNLTVYLSRDGGRSWPVHKRLHTGPAAYSELVALPDGDVLCFYEAGTQRAKESLCVARFGETWFAVP